MVKPVRQYVQALEPAWRGVQGRSVAWVAYVPIPVIFLVPLLAARGDRLARFHGIQGGIATTASLVLLMLAGFYKVARSGVQGAAPPDAAILALVVMVGGLVLCLTGLVAAARGRYLRLRPAWDLAQFWLKA